MTLLTDYQARYSDELRMNASNPQNSGATTINTAREGYAANDAEGDFIAICGVDYDGTNKIHVTAATPLVYYKLLVFTGQADGSWYDKQLERLSKWYRLVLGRNRMVPKSSSNLSPTEPESGLVPMDDISQFQPYVGNAPGDATPMNTGGGDSQPLGE